MITVYDIFGLLCPSCAKDTSIHVHATIPVRLMSDGTIEQVEDADHDWNNRSTAYCTNCNHVATVADFRRGEP